MHIYIKFKKIEKEKRKERKTESFVLIMQRFRHVSHDINNFFSTMIEMHSSIVSLITSNLLPRIHNLSIEIFMIQSILELQWQKQ